MTITSSLVEGFIKRPMKCWLRAANEPMTGTTYADWVKARNEPYRTTETKRAFAAMPFPGQAVSSPPGGLKSAKWRFASEVVVRATAAASNGRGKEVPCAPPGPSETGISGVSGSPSAGSPVLCFIPGPPDLELIPEFNRACRTPPGETPGELASKGAYALLTSESQEKSRLAQPDAAARLRGSPSTYLLETRPHLVERVPSEGRGRAPRFIPIRFRFFNKLSKDNKLLLAYDALVLGRMDVSAVVWSQSFPSWVVWCRCSLLCGLSVMVRASRPLSRETLR